MRKVVFILLCLCLTVGFPIPSRADSIGTASLTWHFGQLTATRAFGLDLSTGGAINYYDATLDSPWVWGNLLASQWPASDGLGNTVTGDPGAARGSTIAQSLEFVAHAPSATMGAWTQAAFGNSWYLPNAETFGFTVDWAFSGHTDSAPAPDAWALLFGFQMSVVYNNGLPGAERREFTCHTDYSGWDPATGFPYFMTYNAVGYNSGIPIVLDPNGNFSASGTVTIAGCDASAIYTQTGRWVIDYGYAGSGSDYHPDQGPADVPEPALLLLVATGLASLVRRAHAG